MRDAFGGVFMMRFFLVFIFIYVTFTAVSLNYAKGFRIKNSVIDAVEQSQMTGARAIPNSVFKKIDAIVTRANYNKECKNGNGLLKRFGGDAQAYCYRGIVIEEKEKTARYVTYNIYTYADWNIGALNMVFRLTGANENANAIVDGAWEISGLAKVTKRQTSKYKK